MRKSTVVIAGLALAIAALGGAASVAVAAIDVATPTATVKATDVLPWSETGLPACDEDTPDPAITAPCVWADDDILWYLHDGTEDAYTPCLTEDSPACIWDSEDIDSAERFWINGSEDR